MPESRCVDIHHLFYTYPGSRRHALCAVDAAISPGSYVAVLGSNGSGKSTLLKCINGLCTPSTGGVTVYGEDGRARDPSVEPELVRRMVGTVLQNPDDTIVGTIVEEDVAFGPQNLGLDPGETRQRVDAALAAVGLDAVRSRPPQFLSGGEKARLAVAAVLAMNPRVLLLDEPAAMLDPRGREALLGVLDRLAADGRTILHVTHSLEDAARAGRCIVLHHGALVFDGRAADLFRRTDLASWGLRLPESVRAIQAFSRLYPGFSVASLEPQVMADALWPYLAAAGSGAEAPVSTVAFATSPALEHDALAFESVGHEYLRGTNFASRGLKDVNLRVPAGTTVALIGATGAGKSTLLRHANGILLPGSGRVTVLGADTLDRETDIRQLRLRANLGIQNPEAALFEPFIADDVAYGPRNKGLKGALLVEAVRQAMDLIALPYEDFKDRRTLELSGGEKRRAALAGVLVLDGELVLLDEPTAALDGAGRERILGVLSALRARGTTVLATTHSMEEAAGFDLVAVMRQGELVACGPPQVLFGTRWDDSWGLALPWTVAVANQLRSRGWDAFAVPPLSAEDLVARIRGITPPPRLAPASHPREPAPVTVTRHRTRRRRGTGIEFFRNVTLGQFLDRPCGLRNLDAGLKMAVLLGLALVAIAGPQPWYAAGILVLTLGIGATAGKTGPKHLLRGLVPALPYLAIMVAAQLGFSWPGDGSPVLFAWGPVAVTVGELTRAFMLVARLATLMALLALYAAQTPLADSLRTFQAWIAPLGRLGFPVRAFSLAFGIALRFVPVLVEEAERIAVAQLSRGGGYGGKGRLRAAAALIVPLFLRALERSETLAIAMELRLFGKNPPRGS